MGRTHASVDIGHHSLGRRSWATKHELGSQPGKTVLIAAEDSVHHGWESSILEDSILALHNGNKQEGIHSSIGQLFCYCLFILSFQVKGHILPTFRVEHCHLLIPPGKSLTCTSRNMLLWFPRWFQSNWKCINHQKILTAPIYYYISFYNFVWKVISQGN